MYRWYHDAVTCYVYLADVTVWTVNTFANPYVPIQSGPLEKREVSSTQELNTLADIVSVSEFYPAFRSSRWFTRGWTLQELLAPVSVEFYSKHGYRLGDRTTLVQQIQLSTGIAEAALRGSPLSSFTVEERISWARERITKREEDAAYSLLGLFDIHMPLIYGEGRRNALKRLQREIVKASREELPSPMLSLSSVDASSDTTPRPNSISTVVVSGPIEYARTRGASTGHSVPRVPTLDAVPNLHFVFRIDEIRTESVQIIPGVGETGKYMRVSEGITGRWWTCGSSIRQVEGMPASYRPFDISSVWYTTGLYSVAQGGKPISPHCRAGLCVLVQYVTRVSYPNDISSFGITMTTLTFDIPDVTCPPREDGVEWHGLRFLHNNEDFSSSLHIHGTHPTLRCHRDGSSWPSSLLPNRYHGPLDTSKRYGGLRGSLSILLALLALSIRPEQLQELFPKLQNNGQWTWPKNQDGSMFKSIIVGYSSS